MSSLLACSPNKQPEWLVVNYWATWCGPCREEIPELNELAALNPQALVVVGVNYDAPQGEEAKEQSDSMGIAFENISIADAEKLGLITPSTLPTTFVLQNGKVMQELKGPQTMASLRSVTGL
ncbi:MAG: TlpA family protein disulfide reductase [Pseudomonadales bacterium]